MQCTKCKVGYEEDVTQFRIEACNKLFCFDDTPVLKCPKCGAVFVKEETTRGVLARVKSLNSSSFPYHRVRWDKFQIPGVDTKTMKLEDPDEIVANRLLLMSRQTVKSKETKSKSSVSSDFPAALSYIEQHQHRIIEMRLTKKNLLKGFSWRFEAGKGMKKDEVVSAMMEKIKAGKNGIFAYSCKADDDCGLENFQYSLVVDGSVCYLYQKNDPATKIWKYMQRS